MTLKAKKNLSYRDAKAQLAFTSKGTFAEAVHRGRARSVASAGTQTSLDDLRLLAQSPTTPKTAVPTPPAHQEGGLSTSSQRQKVAIPATPAQEDSGPSKSSQRQKVAISATPATLTSRGRGLPLRPLGPPGKPGEPSRLPTPKDQQTVVEEPMDESGHKSDEDVPLSGSQYSLSASSDSTERQKDTAKKKNAPRIKIDF